MTRLAPSGAAFTAAARAIGCEPAMLDAVLAVESRGTGFDTQGRIKILFEKHKFHAYLPPEKRRAARRAGLAVKRWQGDAQYHDQRGYDARWRLLERAREIDNAAALKATSFGIGQIMGKNHRLAGYGTVSKMVAAFKNTDAQLLGVANFIINSGLADEFRQRDFAAIARFYNGPGQVAIYAAKFKKAYAKSRLGKQAHLPGQRAWRSNTLRLGSFGDEVVSLQTRLNALGYFGDVDGDFGRRTREQVMLFQSHHGLKSDGLVGESTKNALKDAVPRSENLRPVSGIVRQSPAAQVGLSTVSVGGIAAVSKLADSVTSPAATTAPDTSLTSLPLDQNVMTKLEQAAQSARQVQDIVTPIHTLSQFAFDNAMFALAFLAIGLGLYATHHAVASYRRRIWR